MPSHLTRGVFRNIIANKPLLYRGCLHRSSRPQIAVHHGIRTLPIAIQRRTFFDFFKPQRKAKSAELPAGMDKLAEVSRMQMVAARPPPPDQVAAAFKEFFPRTGKQYEDFHIRIAETAYQYLRDSPKEDGTPWFDALELARVYTSLVIAPETGGKPHIALARLVHAELESQWAKEEDAEQKIKQESLKYLLRVLCLYGESSEARDIAGTAFRGPIDSEAFNMTKKMVASVWLNILSGFAREKNREELDRTAEMMREFSIPLLPSMQTILVSFYSKTGDVAQAKRWYGEQVVQLSDLKVMEPQLAANAAILKACALAGDVDFGQNVVASLLKEAPSKEAWDAIFIWSAAIGKGVDEVERMMKVMIRRSDEAQQQNHSATVIRPDIDTINALVDLSVSKKDPYSAERYITLGEKLGIQPNARTYAMQMQYRLAANDLDGARTAFYGLEGTLSASDTFSVSVTNLLIRALCNSKTQNFDDVMSIVDSLSSLKARFDPETIATLCVLHLRRGEAHDAIDLIQLHAHQYSPTQRQTIRNHLVTFLLDRQNSTTDAWDTYQTLRQLFPETPRDVRIKIMNEFFARKRSDMACHVFFHMRNHASPLITSTHEVYIAAFVGFARTSDAESLELVHNQLKLDLNVELDTKLRNALMLAYASTEQCERALEYWGEIVLSREGPTFESIRIALRACEGMPWGDERARPIWRRLKAMGVEIDSELFLSYLCAIAGNHFYDESIQLLETVEEEYGFRPDFWMLANWFNSTRNIERQRRAEKWIKEHYPDVWPQMADRGFEVTMEGFGWRQCKIERVLDP